jgi:hypothetical protein
MLSGCLALIEAVANKQRFTTEIPAFNIFDNFADLLVLIASFIASIVPGFIIGSLVGGDDTYALWGPLGMVVSGCALFPIFLLSMMDNGSLFNPISQSVVRSLTEASEAWGGYYLKTFIATAVLALIWLVLLGRHPILSGVCGSLVPLYIFFVCQQIGTLADKIADCLSFEFKPPKPEEDGAEEGKAV